MAGGKQTSLDGSPTRTEFWLLGPHLPPQRPGAKDSYTDPARQYFTGICVTEIQKGALAPRQGYNPGMNPARDLFDLFQSALLGVTPTIINTHTVPF